jgi:hypothetical protein
MSSLVLIQTPIVDNNGFQHSFILKFGGNSLVRRIDPGTFPLVLYGSPESEIFRRFGKLHIFQIFVLFIDTAAILGLKIITGVPENP